MRRSPTSKQYEKENGSYLIVLGQFVEEVKGLEIFDGMNLQLFQ